MLCYHKDSDNDVIDDVCRIGIPLSKIISQEKHMFTDRLGLYRELEKEFGGKLLVYVTSDRPNMSAQIAPDVIDLYFPLSFSNNPH